MMVQQFDVEVVPFSEGNYIRTNGLTELLMRRRRRRRRRKEV
jgi:hypothetical protein